MTDQPIQLMQVNNIRSGRPDWMIVTDTIKPKEAQVTLPHGSFLSAVIGKTHRTRVFFMDPPKKKNTKKPSNFETPKRKKAPNSQKTEINQRPIALNIQ